MAKERKSAPRRRKKAAKKAPAKRASDRKAAREHKASRPIGRPHRCVPKVINDVVTALGVSSSNADAANYAGISGTCLQTYFERARKALVDVELDPDEPPDEAWTHKDLHDEERPFVEMLTRCIRARARGRIGLLAIAHKCAKGGAVFEERVDPETGQRTQVQVGFIEPDPRTALKLLAVRKPHDYAEKRQLALSAEGGAAIGVQLFLPVLEGEEPDAAAEGEEDDGSE